jgi:hypothetical protein
VTGLRSLCVHTSSNARGLLRELKRLQHLSELSYLSYSPKYQTVSLSAKVSCLLTR